MKSIKKEITDLLITLNSNDIQIRNKAITTIALLLEMNRYISNGNEDLLVMRGYSYYLDEDLLSLRLDTDEETFLVNELLRRVLSGDTCKSSLIWAIGKARPEVGLSRLIEIIKSHGNSFDDEMAYQTIISLENFMDYDIKETLLPNSEIISFLDKNCKSNNTKLSESANRVLRKYNLKLLICPKEKCFFWLESSDKFAKVLYDNLDEALQHTKPAKESGCSCTFGICIRIDKDNGDGDWFEPCEPENNGSK